MTKRGVTDLVNQKVEAQMKIRDEHMAEQIKSAVAESMKFFMSASSKSIPPQPSSSKRDSPNLNRDISMGDKSSKLMREENCKNRIASLQRRMKYEVKNNEEYRELLRNLHKEVQQDLDSFGMELHRFSLHEDSNIKGICCRHYQYNGCNDKKNCHLQFIHGEPDQEEANEGRGRKSSYHHSKNQRDYGRYHHSNERALQNSERHQRRDRNNHQNYYIHSCVLCHTVRKGLTFHNLWNCELLMDMDKFQKNPTGYKPIFMTKVEEYVPE